MGASLEAVAVIAPFVLKPQPPGCPYHFLRRVVRDPRPGRRELWGAVCVQEFWGMAWSWMGEQGVVDPKGSSHRTVLEPVVVESNPTFISPIGDVYGVSRQTMTIDPFM